MILTQIRKEEEEDSFPLPQLFEEERRLLQIKLAQRPKTEQPAPQAAPQAAPLPLPQRPAIATPEEHLDTFMEQLPGLRRAPEGKIPSLVLYALYCNWSKGQHLLPVSCRSFCLHLAANAQRYQIRHTNFLYQGRHVRGFRGITAEYTDAI